jgi:hypothetical protein
MGAVVGLLVVAVVVGAVVVVLTDGMTTKVGPPGRFWWMVTVSSRIVTGHGRSTNIRQV